MTVELISNGGLGSVSDVLKVHFQLKRFYDAILRINDLSITKMQFPVTRV